jgi:hypothetical protein
MKDMRDIMALFGLPPRDALEDCMNNIREACCNSLFRYAGNDAKVIQRLVITQRIFGWIHPRACGIRLVVNMRAMPGYQRHILLKILFEDIGMVEGENISVIAAMYSLPNDLPCIGGKYIVLKHKEAVTVAPYFRVFA